MSTIGTLESDISTKSDFDFRTLRWFIYGPIICELFRYGISHVNQLNCPGEIRLYGVWFTLCLYCGSWARSEGYSGALGILVLRERLGGGS